MINTPNVMANIKQTEKSDDLTLKTYVNNTVSFEMAMSTFNSGIKLSFLKGTVG